MSSNRGALSLAVSLALFAGVVVPVSAGEGPLFAGQLVPLPGLATDMLVGDLDGDGEPDLLVLCRSAATVSVFRGDGGGAFEPVPTQELATFADPRSFDLGDVDGDRVNDLLIAGVNAVAVHTGNGDGTFAAPSGIAGAPAAGEDILLHDLDANGTLDLALTVGTPSAVFVAPGDGAGGFGAFVPHSVGEGPIEVRAALIDGDAHVDLVVLSNVSRDVRVLLGDGALGFTVSAALPTTELGTDVEVGDLDDDGALDVVVSRLTFGPASGIYWLGAGDGTFGAPVPLPETSGSRSVALGDLEGDGDLDIVLQGIGPYILRQGPALAFGPTEKVTVLSWSSTPQEHLTLTDLDGNGILDIVGAADSVDVVGAFLGDASGAYPVFNKVDLPGVPYDLAIGDLDGDGNPDAGVYTTHVTGSTDALWTMLGDGTGVLGPAVLTVVDTNADGTSRRLVFVRIDADEHLDAVMQDSTGDRLLYLPGLGDGTFGAQVPVATDFDPYHLITADMDGDGAADFVTVHELSDRVAVVLGHGDGTFDAPLVTPVGVGPEDVAVGDLDGDGVLDAVTVDTDGETLSVLIGNGDGTFQPAVSYAAAGDPSHIEIADLGGDGVLDVLVGQDNVPVPGVWVYPGLGDGTLGAPEMHPTVGGVDGLALGDLDGDGLLDVVSNSFPSGIAVLLGIGGTALSPPWMFIGRVSQTLEVADLTNDFAPEIIHGISGADTFVNRRLTSWVDLDGASPGVAGRPALTPQGPLEPGSQLTLSLASAPPGALMLAWLSLASAPFPALGGTVHAFPFVVQFPRTADGLGTWTQSLTWPAGIPPGAELWLQFLVQDLSTPDGITLSNGIRGTTR